MPARKIVLRLTLALGLLFLVLPLAAQEAKSGADPGMEAFIAATTPGAPHEYLARFEGEWDYTQSMWQAPGEEPMKAYGKATKQMVMDGRYLQEEMWGEMGGQPFIGRGVTGYDNMAGELVGTWIDNFGTGIIVMRGEITESSKGHVLGGTFKNPMTGLEESLRMATRIVDEDHHVFEYYVVTRDGDHKRMEIEYVRQKPEKAEEPQGPSGP